jgi:hypothetical protein
MQRQAGQRQTVKVSCSRSLLRSASQVAQLRSTAPPRMSLPGTLQPQAEPTLAHWG